MIKDIVDLALMVKDLVQYVYAKLEQMKENKENCKNLIEVVEEIQSKLDMLNREVKDKKYFENIVGKFASLIEKSKKFITEFFETDQIGSAISSEKFSFEIKKFHEKFKELEDRLCAYMVMQQLYNREVDKEEHQRELQEFRTTFEQSHLILMNLIKEPAGELYYNQGLNSFNANKFLIAFGYFCMAAEQSYYKAYCAIGNYYCRPEETGNVMKRTSESNLNALPWFYRGTRAGHLRAEYQMGVLLENGIEHYPKDQKEEAHKCYVHAAEQGQTEAIDRCNALGLKYISTR